MKKSITERVNELKEGLEIDRASLDRDVMRQPQLFHEVSELVTAAIARRDHLKGELEEIEAGLYGTHRRKIDKLNGKATEAQVKNAILLDPKYKTAVEKHLKAKEIADHASNLKEAFHQRRYMLQEMCGLFVANYFESSSMGTGNARDYKAQKAKDSMSEKRKRKMNE